MLCLGGRAPESRERRVSCLVFSGVPVWPSYLLTGERWLSAGPQRLPAAGSELWCLGRTVSQMVACAWLCPEV